MLVLRRLEPYPCSWKLMSLYEVLVIVALVAAGGFAYHLYRSDIRSPKAQQAESAGEPMFGRTPRKRTDGGAESGAPGHGSGNRRE